jgi:hypothetical protein
LGKRKKTWGFNRFENDGSFVVSEFLSRQDEKFVEVFLSPCFCLALRVMKCRNKSIHRRKAKGARHKAQGDNLTSWNFYNLLKIGVFLRLVVLPYTWNDGMVEYWKVEDPVFSGIVFKRKYFINKFPCQSRSQRDQ